MFVVKKQSNFPNLKYLTQIYLMTKLKKKKEMSRIALSCMIILTVLGSVQAQYDPEAKRILDAMAAKYKKIPAFEVKFTTRLENPFEGISEEFGGEITVKGEMFRLLTGEQLIINNGKTVWAYLEEVNEATVDNYHPDEETISPTHIYTAYQDGFKYVINGTKTYKKQVYDVIDLIPEDKEKVFFKVRLVISKKNNTLKTWTIFEKTGNRYTYLINSFKPMPQLANSYFEFDAKKHPNVEVVDLR